MADAQHQVTIILSADAGRLGSGLRQGRDELESLRGSSNQTSSELGRLSGEADRAGGSVAGAAGHFRNADQAMDGMASRSGLAGQAMGMLGSLMAGLGIATLVSELFSVNMEFESLRASLETVTGSTTLATAAFAGIQDFAAKTPYSVKEVTEAFIGLQSRGLEPSERALTSYGNTAGGLSKSLKQMFEAVADAATGEFERLKEFGINASAHGDKVIFTFRGVATSVQKDAASIQEYLIRLGETDFAGGMERQSATMKGALSNLGDAWDALLDNILSSSTENAIAGWVQTGAAALQWISTDGIPTFRAAFVAGLAQIEIAWTTVSAAATDAWSMISTAGEIALNAITQVSANAMALMQGGWVSLQGVGEVVWITIKSAAGAAINVISGLMSDFIASAAAGLEWLGATETANSMKSMADALNPAKQGFGELKDKIGEVNAVTAQRLAQIDTDKAKTLEQSGALKTVGQSLQDLNTKLSEHRTQTNRHIDSLNQAAEATVKSIAVDEKHKMSLDEVVKQLPKNTQSTKELTDAQQKLLDKTLPLQAAEREHGEQLKGLKQLLDQGKISQDQYNLAVQNADTALRKKTDSLNGATTSHKAHKTAVDETQKAEEKWNQELTKTLEALNPAQKATNELSKTMGILDQALAKGKITQEIYNEKLFEANNLYEANVNKVQKATEAKQKHQSETERLIASLEEELALMGYSGTELEVQTALRHAHAEGVMDQDQRLRDLIETVAQETEVVRMQEAAWQDVDQAFLNFFRSGLTNFKQFATDIKEMFLNLLAEMAYAALKNKLMISVGLSASGAAGAAGGAGGAGGGMDLASLGSAVNGIFGGAGLIGTAASWLGATALGSTAFGGGLVAGLAGAGGGIMSAVGAIYAGVQSMVAGSVAAGLGTALGAVIPVVGWVVAIAGALGAFGSGKDVTPDLTLGGLPGRYPAAPGEAFVTPKGNPSFNLETTLGPDIAGFAQHVGDPKIAQQIIDRVKQALIPEELLATAITGAAADRVSAALEAAAKKMKVENPKDFEGMIGEFFGDRLRIIIANIDGPLRDAYDSLSALGEVDLNNTEQAAQLVVAMLVVSQATGDLKTTFDTLLNPTLTSVDAIAALAAEGEILATTVVRLGTQLVGVNEILSIFGAQTLDLSLAGATAADSLITLLGGVQGFQQATGAYFQAFFSEQEQFQVRVDALRGQFETLGVELPTSTQGLRDLVAGLDLTTESGQQTFASIMQLTPALKEYLAWSEKMTATIQAGITVVADYDREKKTLWQTYQDSTAAVSDLLFQTDLSVQSTEDLAEAADRRRVAELALLQQIDASIAGINQSYDDFGEEIKLAGMTQQQQYEYFMKQAKTMAGSLDSITDPEEYAKAVAEIEELTHKAWNALPADQRAGLSAGFQSFLDEVQGAATARLGAWRNSLLGDDDSLGSQLAARLDPSAAAMQAAAETMEAAIKTAMVAAVKDMQSAVDTQTTAAGQMLQAATVLNQAAANMPTSISVSVDSGEVG